MSNRRDDFSAQVKRTLAERVGYLCSNPSCARPTIGPEERTKDKSRSVGIAAHIAAASPRGPRYDSKQTPEERSSIDNGIWLCQDCARKIDENIDVYAVEELQNWKISAEQRAANALKKSNIHRETPSFFKKMAYVQYVNLDRLRAYVKKDKDDEYLNNLNKHPLDDRSLEEDDVIDKIIKSLDIVSAPYNKSIIFSDDLIGTTFSINEMFYTKNGAKDRSNFDQSLIEKFDIKKSPYIYIKHGEFKIICPYDPRFICSCTANQDFHGGRRKFAGLFFMKHYDADKKIIIMSPVIMVIPAPE